MAELVDAHDSKSCGAILGSSILPPGTITMKPKLLVILGPTATGKSDLAVKIAKKFNGEIISSDSRQVYIGLNIGTGKITRKEMKGVKHYMLDVADPKRKFSVARWKNGAEKAIRQIIKRNKLPIVCGGTGFYIQSIAHGILLPEVPPQRHLRNKLEKKNLRELASILKKFDPERLKSIDKKNPIRLIRAIEIASVLGKVPKLKEADVPYEVLEIGLKLSNEELVKKIHNRLLKRMKKGLVREAKRLHSQGLTWKRMRELGLEYRYLADYIEKKMSKEQFLERIEMEIRHYAKRQITWFKRDKKIKWFEPKQTTHIYREVDAFLAQPSML